MRKIKIFIAETIDELEEKTNKWIEENNGKITIISQQLQVPTSTSGDSENSGYVNIRSTQTIILSLLYQLSAN